MNTQAAINEYGDSLAAKIDERLRLLNGAIDRRIAQLADQTVVPGIPVFSPSDVVRIAADIANYGARKDELIRLKEHL